MTEGSLVVRQATLADLEAVAALLDEISEYHFAALPQFFRHVDARAQAEWTLGQVADNPRAALLVAEADGRVVGLVHLEEREAEAHPVIAPRRYLRVETLVVAESHRGRGIGRSLMRRAHEWGVERGLTEVELGVYEFNRPAIGLYEGLGYETRMRRMARKLAPDDGSDRPGGTVPG